MEGVSSLPRRRRVAVVGAGIVGLCAAVDLAEVGCAVSVVESEHPIAGASGASFAWIGASLRDVIERPAYFELKQMATEAYRRLTAKLGPDSGVRRTGAILWTEDEAEADLLEVEIAAARTAGVEADLIQPGSDLERIEPSLSLPPSAEAVAWLPDDGYVLTSELGRRLLGRLKGLGGLTFFGERADRIESRSAGPRLVLSSGRKIDSDAVVIAAGTQSQVLAETAGARIRLESAASAPSKVIGLVAISGPSCSALSKVVVGTDLMFRPDGGGRILCHSYDADSALASAAERFGAAAIAESVISRSQILLTDGVDLSLGTYRVGERPLPVDGVAIVGWCPGADGVYAAVTHSGVCLAPVLGEIIAKEVGQLRTCPVPSAFRPDRFE